MARRRMLIRFCDIGRSYLAVTLFCGRATAEKKLIDFGAESFASPAWISATADKIKSAFGKAADFDLLIASEKTFRSVNSFPPLKRRALERLNKKALAAEFPNYLRGYLVITERYAYSKGCVYGNYFIARSTAEAFKALARAMGVRCLSCNTLGGYLRLSLEDKLLGGYSFLFVERGAATLVFINDEALLASVDFEYTPAELTKYRLSVGGKCSFEFGRPEFKEFYACTDGELPVGAKAYTYEFDRPSEGARP